MPDQNGPQRTCFGAHGASDWRPRSAGLGDRSGGGRMEDGGLLAGGAGGRFVDRSTRRRGARTDRLGIHITPLVEAVGIEKDRWDWHGDSARATRARARSGPLRPLLVSQRIFREECCGRRATGDEGVEPVEIEQPGGARGDEVVTARPGGTRRAEAVEQEQHQRPNPPPPQSLELYGPHHTLCHRADEFALTTTNLEVVLLEMPIREECAADCEQDTRSRWCVARRSGKKS
jgi:hypothetical protein